MEKGGKSQHPSASNEIELVNAGTLSKHTVVNPADVWLLADADAVTMQ
jgi:hypothetical protein